MSHISTYKAKIQNVSLFLDVCKAKGHDVLQGEQIVQQFGSNRIEAVGSVLIPGWRYRIAITSDGELKYDHFGSQANTMETLGKTIQEYNETALIAEIPHEEIAHYYSEDLADGSRKLVFEYE